MLEKKRYVKMAPIAFPATIKNVIIVLMLLFPLARIIEKTFLKSLF